MDERIREYVACDKALLIAPAGHGKTHALVDCVLAEHERRKYALILTHTHAGIASIKEKMQQEHVPADYAHVETILGFAQRYVLAYASHSQLPAADDKHYFPAIMEKAIRLLEHSVIQSVIAASYDSVYVDEYQDCTQSHNQFIQRIANILPMHLMGDALQGIFDFERLVSFDSDLQDYAKFDFLSTPWRWRKEGNCADLGDRILLVRHMLENGEGVDLRTIANKNLCYNLVPPSMTEIQFYQAVAKPISKIESSSVLILLPNISQEGHQISASERAKILSIIDYRHAFTLLDAIDDQAYYNCTKHIDQFVSSFAQIRKPIHHLCEILHSLSFNKTDYSLWISETHIPMRTGDNRVISMQLQQLYNVYAATPSYANFYVILRFVREELKCKAKRPALCHSVMKAVKNAEGTSAYTQMMLQKNKIRQIGRKVSGRCLGTTLLTKGLEFDNVIIFDAHLFDKKNFYVAISRACKKVYIYTRSERLSFG